MGSWPLAWAVALSLRRKIVQATELPSQEVACTGQASRWERTQ